MTETKVQAVACCFDFFQLFTDIEIYNVYVILEYKSFCNAPVT